MDCPGRYKHTVYIVTICNARAKPRSFEHHGEGRGGFGGGVVHNMNFVFRYSLIKSSLCFQVSFLHFKKISGIFIKNWKL